ERLGAGIVGREADGGLVAAVVLATLSVAVAVAVAVSVATALFDVDPAIRVDADVLHGAAQRQPLAAARAGDAIERARHEVAIARELVEPVRVDVLDMVDIGRDGVERVVDRLSLLQ